MGAYREYRPPAGLVQVVACVWEGDALVDGTQRVVPDGCVDLVWLGDRLLVVGADTKPMVWEAAGAPASGIRLRPGDRQAVFWACLPTKCAINESRCPSSGRR